MPLRSQFDTESEWLAHLRLWFAGMALQGMIAGLYAGPNSGWTIDGNVVAAFEYADAMIERRETK